MRRITVSCPGCGEEFARVPLDEAETVLFHGCPDCRRPLEREGESVPITITAEDAGPEAAPAEGANTEDASDTGEGPGGLTE